MSATLLSKKSTTPTVKPAASLMLNERIEIGSAGQVLDLLKEAGPGARIKIHMHHNKTSLIFSLLTLERRRHISFTGEHVASSLEMVAKSGRWNGVSDGQIVSINNYGDAALFDTAGVFSALVAWMQILETPGCKRTLGSIPEMIKQYPEVCYDEHCMRKTLETFGLGSKADDMMLQLETHETNRNIGWITFKLLRGSGLDHCQFFQAYANTFLDMVQ